MTETTRIKVQLLINDDCKTIMARGEHSKEAVIAAAIESEEIDADDLEMFEGAEFCRVRWFKATPREGYSTYYYESREGVRGAFKATCLQLLW